MLTMSDTPAFAGEVEDLAAMSEPVEEGGGEDAVSEDFSPALKHDMMFFGHRVWYASNLNGDTVSVHSHGEQVLFLRGLDGIG